MARGLGLLLAVLGLAAAACGGGSDGACGLAELVPAGAPASTLDLAAALACDRARAGKVGEAQAAALPAGPQAGSRVGDFKLYNCRVAFAVSGERIGDDFVSFGGALIDADLATPRDATAPLRRSRGRDGLRDAAALSQYALPAPVRVTLVADGSDGGEAIVRAEGPAAAFPLLAWSEPLLFTAPALRFTVDYRLAPGAEALAIDVTARNVGAAPLAVARGALVHPTLLMPPWTPGQGFVSGPWSDVPPLGPELIGFVGDELSYGLFSADGLAATLDLDGIVFTAAPAAAPTVAPCRTTTWRSYLAVVADGPEGLARARRAALGLTPPPSVTGTVTAAGLPQPGARVHATRAADGAVVTAATAAADGTVALALPAGDYALVATPPRGAPGTAAWRGRAEPVAVTVGDAGAGSLTFALPPTGTLHVTVDDGEGGPAAGKVQLVAAATLPAPRPELGETALPDGLAAAAYLDPRDGTARLDLAPGGYHVTLTRGSEAAPVAADVTITAGATTTFAARLPPLADRTGWLALDSHLHADPSMDGRTTVEERLLGALGEGLDVAVATEHDVVTEYAPVLAALGLTDALAGFGGVEVSPSGLGAFGLYPLQIRPDAANFGAPLWWLGFDPATALPSLRAENNGVILQLNAPRDPATGFLEHCGFDPATGQATRNVADFTLAFDAIEVVRGREDPAAVLVDYAGLLNLGHPVAPIGASDAHGLFDQPAGCARTYLRTDATRLTVTAAALTHAIRAQRTVASRGLFVEARLGHATLGDLTGMAGAAAGLWVRVSGPPFADLTEVVVLENGSAVVTRAVTPADAVPGTAVLLEATFPLAPTRDAWYVVVARGVADLAPACPGATPVAVTSPIYLDADGDGVVTPLIGP